MGPVLLFVFMFIMFVSVYVWLSFAARACCLSIFLSSYFIVVLVVIVIVLCVY